MEKPLIGADSPRCPRADWRAFCQDSASTKSDSLSLLPSEVTSTSQRTRNTYQRGNRPVNASPGEKRPSYSARRPSAGRRRAAYTAGGIVKMTQMSTATMAGITNSIACIDTGRREMK